MTDIAALAGWTPVALARAGGDWAIDWGDLRGVRFTEPFWQQTVERWAGGDPAPLVRTGFDALRALDDRPSLDPALIIFHLSHCGSTLLARLLGTLPGTLVLSEPGPVNALLGDAAADAETLRLLVRALGRRRGGDEQRLVVKLSSWNVLHWALVRRAFPAAKFVWVQRAPGDVAAALLADPPGWLAAQRDPGAACIERLTALLQAADGLAGDALVLDHRDLPAAAWEHATPLMGVTATPDDIGRMREAALFDAKLAERRPFAGAAPRAPLPDGVRALVAARAEPLYHAIGGRRREGLPGDGRPITAAAG